MTPHPLPRAIRYALLLPLLSLLLCAGAHAQGTNFKFMKAPGGSAIDKNGNVWVSYLIPDGSGVYVSQYSTAGALLRTVTLSGYWPLSIETEPTTGYIWAVETEGRVIKINPATGGVAGLFNMRTLATDACHIYDAASGTVDCFGGLISTRSSSYGDLSFWVNPDDGARYLFVSGTSTAFPFVTRLRLTNDTPSGARVLASSRASASPYSNVTRGVAAAYNGYVMTTLPLGAVGGTYDRIHVFDALFDLENGLYPVPLSDDFVDSRGMTADALGGFYIATGSNGTVLCAGGGDVVYITPDFSRYFCYGFGQVVANTRDVAVSNLGNAIYVPVLNQDRVVRFSTPDLCSYFIFSDGDDFNSAGGTGSVDVETEGACPWQAKSNAAWITITAGGSGTGSGTVSYSVAANTTTAARTGTITVAGETYTVTQAGAPCTYTLGATSRDVTAAAATGSVTITSLAGCAWTAVSNNTAWLNVTAGASGTGSGTVSYSAAANTGPARTGTLTIGGQTFTLTQGAGCAYTISPTTLGFAAAGGAASITVTPGNAACPWTAVSNVPWVTVTSGAAGTGAGTVGYSVEANNGPARTGTLTVAGKTYTVTQSSGCAYSINPTGRSHTAAAGTGTVNVTTAAGCTWAAATNAATWLNITAGASGTGNGTVNYSVAAKTGPARTGTLTIAGQTFTVLQNNPPTVNLTAPAGGASFAAPASVNLTAAASDTDGTIARVDFYAGTTLLGSSTAVPYGVTWNATTPGVHSLKAVAVDNSGGTTTSAATSINVTGEAPVGLQYYPLAHPVRLLDTRPGTTACHTPGAPLAAGASRTQAATGTCGGLTIPATAKAIVGNATVVSPANAGFITLYPSDAALPTVSNLNYVRNQIVPNAFTVGLSSTGAFNVYTPTSTHFIVDVAGYYAPPGEGGLYYHPLPRPVRLLDTRIGATACDAPGASLQAGVARVESARTTCDGVALPNDALTIVGNATVVNTSAGAAAGHITLYPSGAARPTASNLNYVGGQIVPNAFTVGLGGDGAFNIYAASTTHFIVDVTGYYSASAAPDVNGVAGLLFYALPSPVRLLDTRAGATACSTPGRPLAANSVQTQGARLTCGTVTVPGTALAVVGNATAVNTLAGAGGGHVTLYPSGAARPNVSNLNYVPGQVVPNSFTVGLGGDGAFNIYASTTLNFIADVSGYFAP